MLIRCHNRVVLLLLLVMAAAALLPFLSLAPNRLVSGSPVHISDLAAAAFWQPALLWAALTVLAFVPGRKALMATLLLSEALFALLMWRSGDAARQLIADSGALARVSVGSGLWLMLAMTLLMFSDAAQRLFKTALVRVLLNLQLLLIPLALLLSGGFEALSLLREYSNRQDVFNDAVGQHLMLLFGTLVPALAIGIAVGLWCHRRPASQAPVFAVLNVIQTVPSVALFGLLMVPLSGLASALPLLGQWGISGIGLAPALIALVLYALLPLVRGVVAGLGQVPREVLESARAMGMSSRQIFFKAQVPLALPVLLRSLRVVAIQTVGMAVIAALIGAGGFGALVFQGLLSSALDLVLLGVIPVIALAVIMDALFNLAIAALEAKHHD